MFGTVYLCETSHTICVYTSNADYNVHAFYNSRCERMSCSSVKLIEWKIRSQRRKLRQVGAMVITDGEVVTGQHIRIFTFSGCEGPFFVIVHIHSFQFASQRLYWRFNGFVVVRWVTALQQNHWISNTISLYGIWLLRSHQIDLSGCQHLVHRNLKIDTPQFLESRRLIEGTQRLEVIQIFSILCVIYSFFVTEIKIHFPSIEGRKKKDARDYKYFSIWKDWSSSHV
jgi:hypothetical protein